MTVAGNDMRRYNYLQEGSERGALCRCQDFSCSESPPPSKAERKRVREGSKTEVCDQSGCSMLSRLPYELRMMIYQEVLGGHMLHIMSMEELWGERDKGDRRLSHIKCSGCVCSCCAYDLTSIDRWGGDTAGGLSGCGCNLRRNGGGLKAMCDDMMGIRDTKKPIHHDTGDGLLSLLMTCQQVYSEAITTLYSSNTFDFPHFGAIFAFKASIPPQHHAAIRSIQLHYTYSFSFTGGYHLHSIRVPLGKSPWFNIIAGDKDSENNRAMTSLEQIRIAIPEDCEFVPCWDTNYVFKPTGDLVNAVARVQSERRDAISVIVDYPIMLDRFQEKLAEVLERASFLIVRTPRFYDIPYRG